MVIDEVPTGRLVLENQELIAAEDELFRTRRRLMNHGTILVGLVLDQYGALLASPRCPPSARSIWSASPVCTMAC